MVPAGLDRGDNEHLGNGKKQSSGQAGAALSGSLQL
jgi:hypothetical protein